MKTLNIGTNLHPCKLRSIQTFKLILIKKHKKMFYLIVRIYLDDH